MAINCSLWWSWEPIAKLNLDCHGNISLSMCEGCRPYSRDSAVRAAWAAIAFTHSQCSRGGLAGVCNCQVCVGRTRPAVYWLCNKVTYWLNSGPSVVCFIYPQHHHSSDLWWSGSEQRLWSLSNTRDMTFNYNIYLQCTNSDWTAKCKHILTFVYLHWNPIYCPSWDHNHPSRNLNHSSQDINHTSWNINHSSGNFNH